MQVTNVRVVYTRKRQPAQFESSGAEIEFTAIIGDDGNHVEAAKALLADAKTLVLTELGIVKAGESASAHARSAPQPEPQTGEAGQKGDTGTPPATAGEKHTNKRGGGKKKDEPAAQQQPQPETPAPSAAGIPGDNQTETALGRSIPASAPGNAAAEKPNGSAADIPSDVPAASVTQPTAVPQTQGNSGAAAGAIAVDVSTVQKYVADCLAKKKFLPPVVLGKLKTDYQVERVGDLSPEKLKKFFNEIRAVAGDPAVA